MDNKTSPITYAQQGVYIDCILDPENLRYNNPQSVSIPAGIPAEAVCDAVRKVFECHPALFSHFEDRGGCATQVYTPECHAEVRITKTEDKDVDALKAAFIRVFDLGQEPLYRAEVLDAPSGVTLLVDFHHLVYDGASLNILMNEICAALEGKEPTAEVTSYADFAEAQHADKTTHGFDKPTNHKSYYDGLLDGITSTQIPSDLNGGEGIHREHVQFVSTPDVMAKAKSLDTAPSALFMAAAFYTLSRYTNTKELCMTTISNGRQNPMTKGIVGMFVNTLPLVSKIGDTSVCEYIHGVRSMFQDVRQHEEYPFATLVNDYGIEQHVRFTYQYGTFGNTFHVNGEDMKAEAMRANSHTFPFTITISNIDDKPAIVINYDTAKYSADLVNRFAESMDAVVSHFLEEPDGKLLSVSIMSERQHAELANMRQTCIDHSAVRFPLFHKSLEYWAEQTPDATVIIACNETLTYRQFNGKANVLAHALMNKGVVRGDRICLLLPRKSWHLIAMFGVMKTGAAYIPCDPEYPAERIRLITDDSHARYVITTKDKMGDYGARALDVEVLLNDDSAGSPTNYSNPDVEVSPDDLAYLIYTSGSTGRPKGVMLRHIGICNYLTDHEENRHFHALVNNCKTMLCITTVSFDLSLKEIGSSLYNGMTLVFANEDQVNDPQALANLMTATNVDGFSGTPSRLKMFLDLPDFQNALARCKFIVLGGEKYPPTLLPQIKALAPGARLFNTYGPTEISVSCNGKELTHADHITIGRPLLNVKEYVVDDDLNELPVGVTGELLIGGLGVSAGYNDLPEKTAEAFIDYNGECCYKSGDYAYWNAEGDVVILGRKDHQIKLNGLRIELGEVETVLNRQPQVKEGVVMIRNVEGHDHLVAYYVPATSDAEADLVGTLKEQMGKSLTHYMVPAIFVRMDKMPISPNGKTDLKALPQPVIELSETEKVMPTTADEQSLYDIVAEIVGNGNFGITTNLVGVGLTSLLAIRLSVFVNGRMNASLSVRDILKYPTIKELATKLQRTDHGAMKHAANQSAPLSFSQLGIYSECISSPDDIQYNIPVCIRLPQGITTTEAKAALEKVLAAHPFVYNHFQDDDNGDAYQCLMENKSAEIPIVTMTGQELEQEKKSFVRPFALKESPLFRLKVVDCDSSVYVMSDFHHLVMDGGSYDIFYRQLCQALDGKELETEQYDYYQFVADQKIDAATEQFFAEQLGQIEEASALLPDRYDGDDSHRQAEVTVPTDLQAAQAKCKQLNITPAALYLAATAIAVSKYTAEETVGICTVSNGRGNLQIANTFGMFVNTLPLVSNADTSLTVDDYLRKTAGTFVDTLANEDYPYGKVVENFGYIASILYAYQVGVLNKYSCSKGELTIQKLELQKAKFPVSVLIEGSVEQGGVIRIQYDESLFTPDMMKGFAAAVQHIAADLIVTERMSDVSVCTDEMISLLDSFNVNRLAVSAEEDAGETVLSLFQRTALQYPDNIAAVFKDRKYTYRELDELTDKIGGDIYNKVKDCGKAEPVVSILIPRNEYIFILPLAAMKAGCAYQPLDPSYPQERLNFMVKDADAALLIADPGLKDIISGYEGEVVLTSDLEHSNSFPLREGQGLGQPLTPQSLFILLYTSGSTGVPKGVMLEHQNLMAFIKWYRRYYNLKPEHNVAAYASFGFDANMMDLYPALTTGATVYVVAEELRLDLVALNDYFEANAITHSFITTQVGVQFLQNTDNRSLKHLSVGGEKLVSVDSPKNYSLHNGYGPTECTIFTTTMPVMKKESNIPIGKPTDLLDCFVMDKHLHRLPVGAAGELVVAGKQVGRGYLNRPDKTAEAFFTLNGERAYHTGDIVRYRQDGNIEFVGRKDGQVKIRGFRIELKEVEAVIRDFASIRDVTVQAFDDPNGGKFIAAYIVSDEAVDIDALNQFILDQKPPYMVPAVTMQIEKIPLNVNQKVDKKSLPKPEPKTRTGSGDAPAAPLNALETQLKAIIASVTGTEDFTITDVLGYIGLTSISSIKLATLIYKKFGVQVNAKTLARAGSLQSIENEILEVWMNGNGNENENKNENDGNSSASAPLTYPQTGVYLDCMKNPGTTLYNVPVRFTFAKNITVKELQDAIRATVDNHQSFRLTFATVDGEIRQILNNDIPVEVPVSKLSDSESDAYEHDFVRPFNLAQGPLFRFEIVETENRLHLFIDIHHLVTDGGSIDLIIREITARLNGEETEKEDYPYIQFATSQKAAEGSKEYMAAKAFFDSRLACCEGASEITADLPKNDSANHTLGRSVCPIDIAPVETLARQLGVTPMSVCLAATYYTVSRFVNSRQVYLGTISNGRSNLRTYNTTGMFVNTLALSGEIKEQTVSDFITETAQNFTDTITHEQYPFAQIAADYGFKPEIVFEYQVGVLENHIVRGEQTALKGLTLDLAKFKMKISIEGAPDGGHQVRIGYDEASYSPELAASFAESVCAVISHFAGSPQALVKTVSIMSQAQAQQVGKLHNIATAPVTSQLFYEPIEKFAEIQPDKTALIAVDRTLTYREFNAEANRVAHALMARGVKKGDRVVVLLPRTSAVMLTIFGISKTGAAYIPCDPEYPADRISLITEDSEAAYVVTTKDKMGDYGDKALDVEELLSPSLPGGDGVGSNPNVDVSPDDLVYLIYTSGSTGRPKGVMLRHEGICNYLQCHPGNRHIYAMATEGSCLLCVTTLSFDMSLKEYGMALFNGLTLVLSDENQSNNPVELANLFKQTSADIFNATPSRLLNYMELPEFCNALRQCKCVLSGGEAYSDKLLARLHKLGIKHIFNTYGPTEITVSSNCAELTNTDQITIGQPLLNYTEFVVDTDGNELPVGVVGELYIGGVGVAKGYNNLDKQTSERFVDYKGIRCYRSGDYARWTPDGRVVVLGRMDNQIKLRGLRIELGEVEAAICKVEGVKQAVVMVRKIDDVEHLTAYYTADRRIEIEDMKAQIGTTLTRYMVPTAYLQMDTFPLTPNGKTDIKHLPMPQLAKVGGDYVAPKNKVEEDFCHIFEGILNLEKVSAEDSFFDIGGTSLTVTRVIIEAKNRGYEVAYASVFSHPSPCKLAEFLGSTTTETDPDADIRDFDYEPIRRQLERNTLDAFRNGEHRPLGNVLLTGATGFLGIHVFREIIENYPDSKIWCLLRGKGGVSAEQNFQNMLYFYFETAWQELFGKRIFVIEGDVTDRIEAPDDIQTVINCAAIVKHFSEGTEIEDINVGGCVNCVDWCLEHNARMIQVSTMSVGGSSVNGYPAITKLTEQMLYEGQRIHNQYIHSKIKGERYVLDAIARKGLDGKIMRVGTLSARNSDGEYQLNFSTNSFVGRLRLYGMLGAFPYSSYEYKVEFSPIDEVAKAIALLSQTPSDCTVFHPFNDHFRYLGDVVKAWASLGHDVRYVEDSEYHRLIQEAEKDEKFQKALSALIAYNSKTTSDVIRPLEKNNSYTMQVLLRMGFRWSMTESSYIDQFFRIMYEFRYYSL